MKTILENIKSEPCKRPAYTKYELSQMVREKRNNQKLTLENFAQIYDISPLLLKRIEEAKISFNISMYRACSKILNLSLEELARFDSEELTNISYRTKESDETDKTIINTINFANKLFDEMVMQHKIGIR